MPRIVDKAAPLIDTMEIRKDFRDFGMENPPGWVPTPKAIPQTGEWRADFQGFGMKNPPGWVPTPKPKIQLLNNQLSPSGNMGVDAFAGMGAGDAIKPRTFTAPNIGPTNPLLDVSGGGYAIDYTNPNQPVYHGTPPAPQAAAPGAVAPAPIAADPIAQSDARMAGAQRQVQQQVAAQQRVRDFEGQHLSGAPIGQAGSSEFDAYLAGEIPAYAIQSPAGRRAAYEHAQQNPNYQRDKRTAANSARTEERANTPDPVTGLTPREQLAQGYGTGKAPTAQQQVQHRAKLAEHEAKVQAARKKIQERSATTAQREPSRYVKGMMAEARSEVDVRNAEALDRQQTADAKKKKPREFSLADLSKLVPPPTDDIGTPIPETEQQTIDRLRKAKRMAAAIYGEDEGGVSQEDLEFTAQKHGITIDEVKKRLGMN